MNLAIKSVYENELLKLTDSKFCYSNIGFNARNQRCEPLAVLMEINNFSIQDSEKINITSIIKTLYDSIVIKIP